MKSQPVQRNSSGHGATEVRGHTMRNTIGALLLIAFTPLALAQQNPSNTTAASLRLAGPPLNQHKQATTHAPINPAVQAALTKRPKPAPRAPRANPDPRPHAKLNHPSYGATPITGHRPPPPVYKAAKRTTYAPTGPGPLHANTGAASNQHGIIFVGGHAQGVTPGSKQSLNPQPIPPGHQTFAHPIAPRPAPAVKPKTHGSGSH